MKKLLDEFVFLKKFQAPGWVWEKTVITAEETPSALVSFGEMLGRI